MTISSDSRIVNGSRIIQNGDLSDEGARVECLSCGSITRLNFDNMSQNEFDFWVCQSCWNYLGVYEDGAIHHPVEYLHIPRFGPLKHKLDDFDEMSIIHVEYNEMDNISKALYFANRIAYAGDYSIGGLNLGVHEGLLILDGIDVVGYLAYCPTSDDEEMVLRQIYLAESHRNQGIGSAILRYWWENVASVWYGDEVEEDRYLIENPNENMMKLVMSVGHGGDTSGEPTAYAHSVR